MGCGVQGDIQQLSGIRDPLIDLGVVLTLHKDRGAFFFQAGLFVQYLFELSTVGGRVVGGLLQQFLELRFQLGQSTVDIAKAQSSAGEWDDLGLQGSCNLPNQSFPSRPSWWR